MNISPNIHFTEHNFGPLWRKSAIVLFESLSKTPFRVLFACIFRFLFYFGISSVFESVMMSLHRKYNFTPWKQCDACTRWVWKHRKSILKVKPSLVSVNNNLYSSNTNTGTEAHMKLHTIKDTKRIPCNYKI
jgi:hypothetical protein